MPRDLVNRFGVSVPQASVDLRNFDAKHPGAMRYDKTRKADRITSTASGKIRCDGCDNQIEGDDWVYCPWCAAEIHR